MSTPTPAWGRDSVVLRLDRASTGLLPDADWVFGASTGAGVRVAVVDSGIDAGHPALEGCVDREGGVDVSVDGAGKVNVVAGPHDDVFGHGTACAGIVHALAPDAQITSVRVLGPDLTGRAAAFHAGLAWAVDEGFDVVNLSLGTTRAEWALAFHEVCDRAYFSGTFVVTAANNVRRTSYPSLFASVASVACTTTRDPLRYHANPEPPTEFLARGIEIEVPWLDGTTTTSTGNSYAAPHIAGLAALVKAEHPELTPVQLKAALWAGAANVREAARAGRPVEGAEAAGRRPTAGDSSTGGGTAAAMTQVVRVDPAAAPPPAPPPDTPAPSGPGPSDPGASGLGATTWTVGGYEAAGAARRTPWGVAIPARRGDQSVVVHDLSPNVTDDIERDAVVTAVRLAAGVVHPHLEPVLEVVRARGPLVVTAAARSLADTPVPRPTSEALAVALALLAGLEALHRRGLVHGDVRADAATVDGRGRVRLGWSGVAAALGRPPRPAGRPDHQVAGLAHLAPERLEGAEPTPAADVYGVALVLATVLRGAPLFPPVPDVAALRRQRRVDRPDLAGPDATPLHPDLAAVLTRALAPDPAERPADATTLARVLGWLADDGSL